MPRYTVHHQDFTLPGDPYSVRTCDARSPGEAITAWSGSDIPPEHDRLELRNPITQALEHDWWVDEIPTGTPRSTDAP